MPDSPREELARRIAEFPPEARSYFTGGFAVASSISDEVRSLILKQFIANFRRGKRRVDRSQLRPITKLAARDTEQLVSTYSLVIGLLSGLAATPDDFVTSAKGVLFLPEHESAARSIANLVCENREEINSAIARAQLSAEVLPSLMSFDIAIDFRLRVSDGEVKTAVPVAVVHINTDADDLWLQLSRGDVEDVIKQLSAILEDMKIAEEQLIVRKR